MKKLSALVIFLLAVTAVLALWNTIDAENARIVRLTSRGAYGGASGPQIPYNVEPETLLVEKDTVVIWTLSGAFEAQVLFLDGNKCQKATEAPVGFELDSGETTACYRGVLIPNGGTASLKFKEQGTYEYNVKWANTPQNTRAKVIVY